MAEINQPLFLPVDSLPKFAEAPAPAIDKNSLLEWKDRVLTYQQREKSRESPEQLALFDFAEPHASPNEIDPFSLRKHSHEFWRLPADGGDACIYFVLDDAVPLLLYVGETARSDKRWKGTHYCKQYLENYIYLHRQYGLTVKVCISFWWDVPVQRSPRQKLELQLIHKWLPPFNKQSWNRWGQPFNK